MPAIKAAHPQVRSMLNVCLVFLVQAVVLYLLYLGSTRDLIMSIPLGIACSFVLLTNYALMHEGAHYNLHKSTKINWLLGVVSGWLFPMSFTFFEITHQTHHRGNRTDHEMFDYYYPSDNMLVKRIQWYGILSGAWWFFIPFGSLIMSLYPKVFYSILFKQAKSSAILFDDFTAKDIFKTRVEVILGIGYWFTIWHVLGLSWPSVLIMYCCFAFNWSTRQYVTHAWTARNVIDGAVNLKVSKPMSLLLLNGEWDLVHHQKPFLPWSELPRAGRESEAPVSYIKQYLTLWKGPRPNFEEAPQPVKSIW